MTAIADISDLELAALISSKICHDVIGPVGAIYNGLEVLDEDDDRESRDYALSVIRTFTEQASAKLQFARFAFGAAGSASARIDLGEVGKIATGFVETGKHKLVWAMEPGQLPKEQVKLLLNLVAGAITALPRGGEIHVSNEGSMESPEFAVTCKGAHTRPPQHLREFLSGEIEGDVDALRIQAYYTCRLARSCRMNIAIEESDEQVVLRAAGER